MLGKGQRPVVKLKRHFHFRKQVACPGILGMCFDLRRKKVARSFPVAFLDLRFRLLVDGVGCGGARWT